MTSTRNHKFKELLPKKKSKRKKKKNKKNAKIKDGVY